MCPTSDDLLGLGIAPNLAAEMGNDAVAVTCAGTAQSTATLIKQKNVTLTAASSQTGAILPSGAKVGSPFYLVCTSSTAAVIYAPVGHILVNTGAATSSTNGTATLAQFKSGIVWKSSQTSSSAATWIYGALA